MVGRRIRAAALHHEAAFLIPNQDPPLRDYLLASLHPEYRGFEPTPAGVQVEPAR